MKNKFTLSALTLAIVTPYAFSQVDTSTGAKSEVDTTEVISITGSHIKNSVPTAPVTTITSEDMLAQGISSVEEALASLPQNVVSRTAVTSGDGTSGRDTIGVENVNLRGFGAENTLILVNGRRPAGSTANIDNGANINAIPFSAIERIEVLTDGASSIYGSDAVAGVVNIILKNGYDQSETISVRYDKGSNGGDIQKLDLTFGKTWEKSNLVGSLAYEHQDAMRLTDVGYTTSNYSSSGGPDFRLGSTNPFNLSQVPGAVSTPDTLVDLHDFNPAFPVGTFVPVSGQFLGGVDPNRITSEPVTFADFSEDNLAPFDDLGRDLTGETELISSYLRYEHDVNGSLHVYADGYYTFSKSNISLNAPSIGITTGDGVIVPTSNAFNATGQDLVVRYLFDEELAAGLIPRHSFESENNSFGISLGAKIELPFEDWGIESFISYGKDTLDSGDLYQNPNIDKLNAVLADSDPTSALNVFGDGAQQNVTALQGLFNNILTEESNEIAQIQAIASGTLTDLPTGSVMSAIGMDFRKEKTSFSVENTSLFGASDPSRDIKAIFGEVNVPIINNDMDITGIESLDLNASARWEEYDVDAGDIQESFSNTSTSVGIAWYVTQQFKLRGNFGESFKAPQLQDLLRVDPNPEALGFLTAILAGGGVTEDPVTGLPLAELVTSSVGNPQLEAETSKTKSFGFDWRPENALDGLKVSATFTEIETDNAIGSTFSLLFLDADLFIQEAVVRDENQVITGYEIKPLNFASTGLRALDINVDYGFDTEWGNFDLRLSATRTLELYTQSFPTEEKIRTEGTKNGPDKTKARAVFNWSKDNYGASIIANYTSSYENEYQTVDDQVEILQPVDSYLTFDLTAHVNTANGFQIYGGIQNITDEDFPLSYQNGGSSFDGRKVDARGRVIFLEVKKSFDLL